MNILVFNCGSSSLNYKVFEVQNPAHIGGLLAGKAHQVGVKGKNPTCAIDNFLLESKMWVLSPVSLALYSSYNDRPVLPPHPGVSS